MSSNLRFRIDFPTWFLLSPEVKSLMSIFMESAIIAFRGDYNEGSLTKLTGALYMDRIVLRQEDFYIERETSSYGWGIGMMDLVSILGNDDLVYPYNSSTEIYFTNGIPNNEITLVKVNSYIRMGYYDDWEYFLLYPDQGIQVPITITPLVNNVENTDTNRVPVFLDNGETNIDGYPITTCNIDKSSFTPSYTFHLRTSSFTIKYYSDILEDYVEKNLYYKIGICLNPEVSLDLSEIIENFKSSDNLENPMGYSTLDKGQDTTDSEGISYTYFRLSFSTYKENEFEYEVETSSIAQHRFAWGDLANLTESAIFPLKSYDSSGSTYIGWVYIKLYNEDGTPFIHSSTDPEEISVTQLGYRFNENDNITYVEDGEFSWFILKLTDHNMNGGFVEIYFAPTPSGD